MQALLDNAVPPPPQEALCKTSSRPMALVAEFPRSLQTLWS